MEWVLATGNPGKRREMESLLAPLGVRLRLPAEFGAAFAPDETGGTFAANARLKAEAALALTGLPALADDSGLEVAALGGAPGVLSARYGGAGLSAADRNERLLAALAGRTDRAAHFVCALVCLFPDGRSLTAEGVCEGEIAAAPCGAGGFGYDPLFYLPKYGKTMAELPDDEKNRISHRGRAVRALLRQWTPAP
ncbi:MAG: RdgB/HAM1 family non-canonical purine NTP pyrophosphatase [Oscillospiraceae bacterium]|jgi:XTP/dITP diphosphohydrolase|nr:RdgB/HAM1 family non-canonical purine NTP pyrophosphatase [Oscillospiraceae bacterium]